MSFGLKGMLARVRGQDAALPWDELEAEAARQGCSPADIFFDRAGRGDPKRARASVSAAAPAAAIDDRETREQSSQRAAWRGHDPLPAPRTG